MRSALAFAVIATATPALAQGSHGSIGDHCEARDGCSSDLRCVKNVCSGEGDLVTATHPLDQGVQGLVGASIGGSIPMELNGVWGESTQASFRLGILLGGHAQFELDVSPGTTILTYLAPNVLGMFEAAATMGYLVPISDEISWILRIGGGGGFVYGDLTSSTPPLGFGEVRFDVFGVAIRTSKHVLIEANIPSFRVLFFPQSFGSLDVGLMWVTNLTLNYLF